ncbi:hypothetical protein ACI0X9_003398 [Cronobacter turicensis]
MKVHVTVDEDIYPELYELLVSTPIAKRARVLANLAYKACLLSNVALMNPELIAPQKGRKTVKRKSRTPSHAPLADKSNQAAFQADREVKAAVSENKPSQANDTETQFKEQTQEENINSRIEDAGASAIMNNHVMTSFQPNKADGERSDDNATSSNKRRRRILN